MTLPNRIGANILDSAQWGAGADRAMDLIHQLDMAQITVVQGSHPKEAQAFCKRVKDVRGDRTDIFWRVRNLPKVSDEQFPDSMTPQEWFDLMYPYWNDLGVIPVTWNEAIKTDMTPIVNWTLECVELAAKVEMPVATWKTPDGTVTGYKGEQPDNYSIANPLWQRAIELNKPRMDKGEKPLVYIAPHMGFDMQGGGGGHVDRPLEIVDRIERLGLDPRYLGGISFGEITSIGGGWRKLKVNPVALADAADTAFRVWLDPHNGTLHFFCVGDSVGGRWHDEDLSGDDAKPFWDRLETLAKDGRYRVKPFATPAPEPPPVTVPSYIPDPLKVMERYKLRTPGGVFKKIFNSPMSWSEEAGKVADGTVVTFIDERYVNGDWWRRISYEDQVASYRGWIPLEGGTVHFKALTTEVPKVPPDPPAPPVPTTRYRILVEWDSDPRLDQIMTSALNLMTAVVGDKVSVKPVTA